jgi:hypothetical protein
VGEKGAKEKSRSRREGGMRVEKKGMNALSILSSSKCCYF